MTDHAKLADILEHTSFMEPEILLQAATALRALVAENEKLNVTLNGLRKVSEELDHQVDELEEAFNEACQDINKKDAELASLKARAVPTLEPQHIELVMKEMRVSGTVNVIRWWRAFQNAINATGEKK